MIRRTAALALIATLCAGCSIQRFAVNRVGDALAGGGSVWERDDDLELVGQALPFSLKLIESLLEVSPNHVGMLETACKGFATYGYVWVQIPAEESARESFATARAGRTRARRLFLRANTYGARALERTYPGIVTQLTDDPRAAASRIRRRHMSLLYWNAAAMGLAIAASKDDASMLARLPEVEALVARGLELDERWDDGALHELMLQIAGARPGAQDDQALDAHFARALELSGGTRASLFVSYAEIVAVARQDADLFRSLLDRALGVDIDARPDERLAGLVAQRRARRLLDEIDDLILETP